MSRIPNRQERGTAMIVAMAVVLLLASLSTVMMSEMVTRSTRVEVQQEDMLAFEAAEAGVDAAINDINQTPTIPLVWNGTPVKTANDRPVVIHDPARKPGCLGTRNWNKNVDDLLPAGPRGANYVARPTWKSVPIGGIFHDTNITPQSLGDVAFFTYAVDWLSDGVDNDGNGLIDDPNERNKFTIYSTGIHRGMVKTGTTQTGRIITVQVIVQAKDRDLPALPSGPLELQIKPRNNP
jgi:type II secretory pathway pseudopilin PulG